MNRLGQRAHRFLVPLALLGALAPWFALGQGGPTQPRDDDSVRSRVGRLIGFLDSPGYAQRVSWDEHVVLAYRLSQGRSPTPLEAYLLRALRDDIGLSRSAVLSVALRGDRPYPTWSQCRALTRRIGASHFRANQDTSSLARNLAAVPERQILDELGHILEAAVPPRPMEPALQTPVSGVAYNTYYGYLHAHSGLSDGDAEPWEAYLFAHQQGGLDFFALTDHGENLLVWPWERKWEQLVEAAELNDLPGEYVTLWGFEWSNPILGHISILNTRDFTSILSNFGLASIYDWIIARPDAFARFNHPGVFDFLGLEFNHLRAYPQAVPQMVGIETWNKNDSFDRFFYNGNWRPWSKLSFFDVGNRRGWTLGALGGQDNHSSDWGTRNDFRTAVLAEGLTREQVVDAYRNRRFYSTEDKDLHLDLRCQGYPMGSRLSVVKRDFEVTAWDWSGDTFAEVRLYRNGHPIQTLAVAGAQIQVSLSDPFSDRAAYYVVVVRQNDDNDGNGRNDEAISSPIWIE